MNLTNPTLTAIATPETQARQNVDRNVDRNAEHDAGFSQQLAAYYPYPANVNELRSRGTQQVRQTTAVEAAHNRDRRRQPGN